MTDVHDQRDDSDPPGSLGRSLRALRAAAGLNQTELADLTGLSQSQISRAETDRRLLAPDDVVRFADACRADSREKDQLVGLAETLAREYVDARATLQRGAHHFQERIRRYEEDSTLVRAYQPGMVLGQLQTTEYSRAVFASRDGRAPEEVERLVAQRRHRAGQLHDPVRRWEMIQTEGALTWCLDGPGMMAEQMEHLLSVSTLRNVDLGIVPAFQTADFTASHGFHIYDSAVVQVGTKNATALLSEREDIVTYATLFSRIADLAVRGDEARQILARLADEYRART
ncbi:MAG: helix-turn-helix domain-containing protein [Pseudonocardia sp.]